MLKFIQKLNQNRKIEASFKNLLALSPSLRSQGGQDLFALLVNDFKLDGYFVEFGATDGVTLSNTWLLEKRFNWKGIVAEPAMHWRSDLTKNRSCNIDFNCVWHTTGENLEFIETKEQTLSTIKKFHNHDGRQRLNREGEGSNSFYRVATISLNDLLKKYNAPRIINFLSIDTEGSEYDILQALDWSYYSFNAICVEHNYTKQRTSIHNLLRSNGYIRILEGLSGSDDYYVTKENLAQQFE